MVIWFWGGVLEMRMSLLLNCCVEKETNEMNLGNGEGFCIAMQR